MITLQHLIDLLERVIKELRYRYGETYIERIKERRTKYEVHLKVDDRPVKIIIDKNNIKARVYTGLPGMEISIRRIVLREYRKELERIRRERQESL